MTDTTTTTTAEFVQLDHAAPAEVGPLSVTMPADLAAALWPALVAVVAHKRDRRPILEGVHVATGARGLTMTTTDTFTAHRVTIPRVVQGVTMPAGADGAAMLPAWKAADVARLCKGATAVRFTAAPSPANLARCEALDAAGEVVGILTGQFDRDADAWPVFADADLWGRQGWPTAGERVGFDAGRLARSAAAADKFGGEDAGPLVWKAANDGRPARFAVARADGARLDVVLMARKIPTTYP
jgi:hypothetical protein